MDSSVEPTTISSSSSSYSSSSCSSSSSNSLPETDDFVPSHTRKWSPDQRSLHSSYVAQHELISDPSLITSTPFTPPSFTSPASILHETSHCVLDYGRGRTWSILQPKQTAKLHKHQAQLSQLIGKQYGQSFDIIDAKGNLQLKSPSQAVSVVSAAASTSTTSILDPSFLPSANNSQLFDKNTSQTLSAADIEALKKKASSPTPSSSSSDSSSESSSVSSSNAIIQALIQGSTTFASKTEFSQEKYIAKKKRKYAAELTVLPPTIENIAETYWLSQPRKIGQLRLDALSQLLTAANIGAGKRTIVVDTVGGLVVGSVVQRQGESGFVVPLYEKGGGTQGQAEALNRFQMTNQMKETILNAPFHVLQHATAPGPITLPSTAASTSSSCTCAEWSRISSQYIDVVALLEGGVDSVILACRYDPTITFDCVFPFLRPSGAFAIFCTALTPLCILYQSLRSRGCVSALTLSESWLREHQVLPNRTHPHVTMSSASGYILAGYKTGTQS